MATFVNALVDCKPNPYWPYPRQCQMYADTEEELHEMARSLGIPKRCFRDLGIPRYVLNEVMRLRAVASGAIDATMNSDNAAELDDCLNWWSMQ